MKPSLTAGIIGAILTLVCAAIPTLFWFSGGLSGEHAFATLFPIGIGIILLVLAVGYAPINGIIWVVLFEKKSWRAIPWMLLSLGGALLIPFIPVFVLFLVYDWRSCLNVALVFGILIGFIVLLSSLLHKYDKTLVLSTFTFSFLLVGIILAASGFVLSIGNAVNTPGTYILMVIGGIGLGIVGLGFGLAAFLVYVASPRERSSVASPDTISIPDVTAGSEINSTDAPAHELKPNPRTITNILGVSSCLVGIGFVGVLALIGTVIAFILWLFRDFSLDFF